MKRTRENKGFTMAELLIVVAIIAVLVAIAIPTFTAQLEKSREGVDAANIRSAYAEVVASRMGAGDTEYYKKVVIKQQNEGWITHNDWPENLFKEAACTNKLSEDDEGLSADFKPKANADDDADTAKFVYVCSSGEGKAYVLFDTDANKPATAVDVTTLAS